MSSGTHLWLFVKTHAMVCLGLHLNEAFLLRDEQESEWVQCLPCKHENLSLDPRTPCKATQSSIELQPCLS